MKTPRGVGASPHPTPHFVLLLCKHEIYVPRYPKSPPASRRGGRRRGAALPLQTFPVPSLAASLPPLLSSLPFSAPRRRWLRGQGAAGQHRCPSGPCPVPAAAPKATSPPSPPPGGPACCGPAWAAQVRGGGREGSLCPRPRSLAEFGNLGKDILFHTLPCSPRRRTCPLSVASAVDFWGTWCLTYSLMFGEFQAFYTHDHTFK